MVDQVQSSQDDCKSGLTKICELVSYPDFLGSSTEGFSSPCHIHSTIVLLLV